MTKYRYQTTKFVPHTFIECDHECDEAPSGEASTKWVLTNRNPKKRGTEILEGYVAPTLKQIAFLVNHAFKTIDFAKSRTKKEATIIIAKKIEEWKQDEQVMENIMREEFAFMAGEEPF